MNEIQTVDDMEAMMLSMPQVECPVTNYFGPGIYIRESFFKAGLLVMGHKHRHEHMNFMVKGRALIANDGVVSELIAPCIFVAKPGRKIAYILEDTVWQNIIATDETDVAKLEDMLVEKSAAFLESETADASMLKQLAGESCPL